MDRRLEEVLLQAQKGNAEECERLIESYRSFILRTASHVCKRQIGWNDDEASISLIAFNEAIGRYDAAHGKSFDNFAHLIIRNRLIDEFRRRRRVVKTESLLLDDSDELDLSLTEIAASMDTYTREMSAAELAEELTRYDEALSEYGIALEKLEEASPDHRDTRMQLIRIAMRFHEQHSLYAQLEKTKRLPISEMVKFSGVSKKTLERNRKYLIALILIYRYGEFERIRSAISFIGGGEER